jgi:Rps23 Pro-64 3,4-dihydroxylase Tpa1-like proline 4-hydroxylase
MKKKKTSIPTQQSALLPSEWQQWLEENVRAGCSTDDIKNVLSQHFSSKVVDSVLVQRGLIDVPYTKQTIAGDHKPKKVYEGPEGIIFDDFLPEETYNALYNFSLTTEYQYINTTDTSLAWHINDGFPLRSKLTAMYKHGRDNSEKPNWEYPTLTAFDSFIEALLAINSEVSHLIGNPGSDWKSASATSWLYPKGTGLSLHDDGAGVYSGAYTYYLNPVWQINWGGLLLMMSPESNRIAHEHKKKTDQLQFYKKQWLQESALDSLMWEDGFAKCVLPKRNRAVFIANDAYHMVTKVNEDAGDRVRMAIAGFFGKNAS